MPGQVTNENLDSDLEEGDELVEDGDDGGDAAGADKTGEPAKDGADKRISDLQSKYDKAEARANKAESALQKLNAGDGTDAGSNDPERKALLEELREASLDSVFGEFAELKEYGIDRALIEGRSRAEMRESATALVGLVKSVATKERNRVLREHGIKAEPAGATRSAPKNYAEMSDEDIEKEIARARSGGPSLW